MKITKRILATLLIGIMGVATLTGCKAKETTVEENVVRIRVYDAGYGTDHLNAIISQFEQTYADKGYKIVIDKANSTYDEATVSKELSVGFKKNKIDMYYASHMSNEKIVNKYVQGSVDNIADLTDVFESAPINVDGSEAEGTLKERLIDGYWDCLQMDLSYAKTQNAAFGEYEGKNYVVPFYSQPAGFIMNTEKMEQAGLETPKTTNELLACVDTINAKREGGDESFANTYPVSWSGGEAYNYWRAIYDVWYAQCEGIDAYDDFFRLSSYADKFTESHKVYETEGWKQVYNLMAVMLDDDNAPADTLSMDAVSAQDRLLVGKSVFAPCGAWLKSEMGTEYLTDMEHCVLIKTPVVSQVGINLGLDGKNGTDAALCEKVLSTVVGLIDEAKSVDEIISSVSGSYAVTLTKEQVEAVQTARGIYQETKDSGWVVAEDSPSIDICKLFLRFLANEYSVGMTMELASVTSAFSKGYEFEDTGNVFDDSVISWSRLAKRYPIAREYGATTVRGIKEFGIFVNTEWEINFGREISANTTTADKYYQSQIDYAKKFLAEYKE